MHVVSEEPIEIGPETPLFRCTFGRSDTGDYTAILEVGPIHPLVLTAMLLDLSLETLNREVGGPSTHSLILNGIAQHIWANVPDEFQPPDSREPGQPCPGCGKVHD